MSDPLASEAPATRSEHTRRNAWLTAAVLVVLAVAVWWFTHSAGSGDKSRARPTASVGVAKVIVGDMPVEVSAIGTVQPTTTALVRAQLAGTLFSIAFREGQLVRKGQILAQIDPRPYRLALAQAEANLTRDTAQLNAARVDLTRYRTLFAQDSIAEQQVATQAALVGQLNGTLAADRAAIGTARLNLQYTSIVAPVSGRIGLRQVDIGNYVTPGDATGLASIAVTAPIDATFTVPQQQLPALQSRLSSGAPVPVIARDQAGTQRLAQGSFLTFDNVIDPTSGTIKAKARFANGEGRLFPGQFVNLLISADTLRHVAQVPVAAIRHGPQGDFVFELLGNRTVKLRVVKSGPSNGQQTAILSGLGNGATVVTEGADGLDDGSPVKLAGKQGGPGQNGAGRHHRQH